MALMEGSFISGEDHYVVAKLDRMKKLTKADIMRVAAVPGQNFVVVKKVKGQAKQPAIEKLGITPVARSRATPKSILDMPVTAIEPVAIAEGKDYERGKLATGELVSVKNQRNSLFSLSFEYDYGRADDRFACLSLQVLVSGAGKRSAEQVSRQLHELGVSVDTGCSKNSAVISSASTATSMPA
jgi:hypothetical protein